MKRKNTTRRFAAIMSIVLAIALILTGTYAWQSIGQQALNQNIGGATPAGGRLHNDMEIMGLNFGEHEWITDSEANKDIYIENFESSHQGRDIFVRVRLYEYMEIGDGAKLHPGDPDFATRAAESVILGANREDASTWAPRIPSNDAISDLFRTYFEWTQGGQKYYMPTFNRDNMSLESDVKGDAVDPHTIPSDETINSTRRGEDYEYPADAGLHDFFELNPTHSALLKSYDTGANGGLGARIVGTSPVQHTARETLDAEIVHISDWDEEVGNFWVLDDDGWAYWGAPLKPETATGLLLDSIKLINEPELEWYYSIFVDAEMATASEWEEAFVTNSASPASEEAIALLEVLVAHEDEEEEEEPEKLSLMKEGLGTLTGTSPTATSLYLGFPALQRGQVETLEFIDMAIPETPSEFNATAFMSDINTDGGFRGEQLIDAIDLTHEEAGYPVVAFYTAGTVANRYNLYIAGTDGVVAIGSLAYLFRNVNQMTDIDLTLLDTSSVTTMLQMFYGATGLTTLDLSTFDTSSVTTMQSMFNGATGLTTLDLSTFDTSSVTTMYAMFYGASGLTTLDLSTFDTSSVTNMQSMFSGSITGLTALDLTSFDTSSVTTMYYMFNGASGLTTLDLSTFDTSSVTTMESMFRDTTSLQHVDFRRATFGAVTQSSSMFTGSGISTFYVGNSAAETFISGAGGWTGKARTITIMPT